MKNTLRILGTALSLGMAHASFAITWTDTSTFSPVFLSSGQSYSGTFDISDGVGGFNSAIHQLTAGTVNASFAFADDDDWDTFYPEYANMQLGNPLGAFITGQETDGDHPSTNFAWYGANVAGTFFTDLGADGKLNWKVTVTSGDTWLKVAKLTASGTTIPNTPGVPDGGSTLALLSAGLMGIVAFRKRFL